MQRYVKLSETSLKYWRSTTTTTTTARGNSFIFISKSNGKTGVIKVNSPTFGQNYRLIVKFEATFDCTFAGRLTPLLLPLSRAFDGKTSARHLHGRNRLGQIFHLTDLHNV